MRKKWDNPALLTVNFAFDSRLLDLVANTYEAQKPPSSSRPKRSQSQKLIPVPKSRPSIPISLLQPLKAPSFSPTPSRISKSLQKKQSVTEQQNQSARQTPSLFSNSNLSKGLRIVHLNRTNVNPFYIEDQMNKKMLKNIRKNILSTHMTQDQLESLENTYKEILKKVRK